MKNRTVTILIVDDVPETHMQVRTGLERENLFYGREAFKSLSAFSPNEARICFRNEAFDLVLLDLAFVGSRADGWDLLGELRRQMPNVPVIILSGNDDESARVRGLRGGADDFIAKPFRTRELTARIEAVLRRTTVSAATEIRSCFPDGVFADVAASCLFAADGSRIALSKTELSLLQYLAANASRVVSREELSARALRQKSDDFVSIHAVEVAIARLRKKLVPAFGEAILTVYGVGYRWLFKGKNASEKSDKKTR